MRIFPWLAAVLVCFTVTAGLAGIKYLQISQAMAMAASFPPPYSVVTAAKAQTVEWTPVRRLTGTVRAPEFVAIAAEATGRIVELPAAPGAVVEKDAVLLRLFDEDLKAQREALEADLNLVKVQLERIQKLKKESLASQDQLDTLLARSQSLRAQIAATDAQLSKLTIRAPFTGRLGIFDQSVGDLMRSGDRLTTLTGVGTTRWIDFKIPQGVARVATGDTVRLLSLDRDFLGNAEIIAVADALAPGLRAFDVRAAIEDSTLRHGELVLVEVQTRNPKIVLSIPSHAVRWDVDGPHVFVLKAAEAEASQPWRAELRRIEVLGEQSGHIMATGELNVGEQYAVEGAFKLANDELVKIAEEVTGA